MTTNPSCHLFNRLAIVTVYGVAWLSLLTLSGCKKEAECDGGSGCIELRGRVGTEQDSSVPLEGATIALSSIGNGSSLLLGAEIPIKQVASDADGSYKIMFRPTEEMQRRGSYRLSYQKQGYGQEMGMERFYKNIGLVPGDRREQNIHLPTLGGQLRIRITGFTGGSATNSITIGVESGRGRLGYFGIPSQVRLYATGTNQVITYDAGKTDISCAVAANQYNFIEIFKLKAGVRTITIDSIYCPLNSSVTYTHAF
jgi:hypothetical protein